MTKKEFIEKYHNTSIHISFNSSIEETMKYINMIGKTADVVKFCEYIGLYTAQSDDITGLKIINISKIADGFPIRAMFAYTYEEFERDFKEYILCQKNKEIKQVEFLLGNIGENTKSVEKVDRSVTEALKSGFIKGKSGNYYALYFHPSGARLFFVCGLGCFKLSDLTWED